MYLKDHLTKNALIRLEGFIKEDTDYSLFYPDSENNYSHLLKDLLI